jgi:hypothetical protein
MWLWFVAIGCRARLQLAQAFDQDVEMLIQIGYIDVVASKVGDCSERCDWVVHKRAIEIAYDVGATLIPRDDYHGAEVARPHFAIECLLDSCVADQDEASALEVKIADGCRVFPLKANGCSVALIVYLRSEVC